MEVIVLPDGSRGLDINRPVTRGIARAIANDGGKFVMRYLSRSAYTNPFDCTKAEAFTIRSFGLALGFVQHVRPGKVWTPRSGEGTQNGIAAREQLHTIGAPRGITIALDLESVNGTPRELSRYVNDWNAELSLGGFEPGLYLGEHYGLTPEQAYHLVTSKRYWSAYNLNLDEYPAHRGVCIRQHSPAYFPVRGLTGYDADITQTDKFGGVWSFWGPLEANI